MVWNSVSEFVAMGGYGVYVWGAYAVTVVLLLIEVLQLRSKRRALDADRPVGAPRLPPER